jgi:hypothetical protein
MLEVTPKNFRQVNGHTRTKAWQKSFMYELQQPRKRNRHRLLQSTRTKRTLRLYKDSLLQEVWFRVKGKQDQKQTPMS